MLNLKSKRSKYSKDSFLKETTPSKREREEHTKPSQKEKLKNVFGKERVNPSNGQEDAICILGFRTTNNLLDDGEHEKLQTTSHPLHRI